MLNRPSYEELVTILVEVEAKLHAANRPALRNGLRLELLKQIRPIIDRAQLSIGV